MNNPCQHTAALDLRIAQQSVEQLRRDAARNGAINFIVLAGAHRRHSLASSEDPGQTARLRSGSFRSRRSKRMGAFLGTVRIIKRRQSVL
ncbi:hypothetical protein XH92_37910 [Bradyrhizobium sp. CCBAU 53421]|nr:hypothetical protein XH92_37910 [Bradyrhizobium sp. CCBAU 53421]